MYHGILYRAYISEMLVLFRPYISVRVPSAQTLRSSTEESHPDTVVEVWARSVQCIASGVRSKLVFRWEYIKATSRFSFLGVIF